MSREQLSPFWSLAVSGAPSNSAEAWSFEISTILAGLLGTIPLDAHILTLSVATFVFLSFPFAIGIAASILTGQLIGEGNAVGARRSFHVSVSLAAAVQLILTIVLWSLARTIADLFSSDEEVADLVAKLLPVSCIFMMADAVQAVVGGVLRGLGRQKLVLGLNILGFWCLAVPCGAILTFTKAINLGVFGLWWGFIVGLYASATIGLICIRFFIDWEGEAEKATSRLATISTIATPPTADTSS